MEIRTLRTTPCWKIRFNLNCKIEETLSKEARRQPINEGHPSFKKIRTHTCAVAAQFNFPPLKSDTLRQIDLIAHNRQINNNGGKR